MRKDGKSNIKSYPFNYAAYFAGINIDQKIKKSQKSEFFIFCCEKGLVIDDFLLIIDYFCESFEPFLAIKICVIREIRGSNYNFLCRFAALRTLLG